MRKYRIVIITIALVALANFVEAREVKFEASLDKPSVAIGESAQLGLSFYGTQDVPAPDPGNIDGLEIRYRGPSTMTTVINGRMSSSITHMYSVLPLRTGKFQLGPFSFKRGNDDYVSNAVMLEVSEEHVPGAAKGEDVVESYNLKDRLFVTLSTEKSAAYVNELIPVTVKMYVNRLNVSDIQLPAFGQEAFSKADFKEPLQYKEEIGGLVYDVLEFKTHIFATRPGDYRVGPAGIKCNLVVKKASRGGGPSRMDDFFDEGFNDPFFESFFTRVERYPVELRSQDAQLLVQPLPAEGRPADFSGAIGDYQFIFNAEPRKVKAGDPITLKMEINGTGNFNTVLIPKLEKTEGFKIYDPQVKTEANRKVFTQVIIPESENITATPQGAFTYFDPNRHTYKTIIQGPIPLQVEKAPEEAPAQVVVTSPAPSGSEGGQRSEDLARDIVYIKESLGPIRPKGVRIYKNKLFLIALPIPLLFLMSLYFVYARRDRLRTDARYAGRIRANKLIKVDLKKLKHLLKPGDEKLFYETLSKVIREYLGSKLLIPPAGITFDVAGQLLASKGTAPDVIAKIKKLFDRCDQALFTLSTSDGATTREDLVQLEEALGALERMRI